MAGTGLTTPADYGFTGEPQDSATGLVQLRARWYRPGSGAFTSRDPWARDTATPQTLNQYSYAHNDPANLTDPTGQFVWLPSAGELAWGALAAAGFTITVAEATVVVAVLGGGALLICLKDAGCRAWLGTQLRAGYASLCGLTSSLQTQWQQGWTTIGSGGQYQVSQSSSSSGKGSREGAPEQPSTPGNISNREFGELMQWGRGSDDARAQIPNLDADKLRRAGLTAEKAEEWADFYRKVAAHNPSNPSAPGRAELMDAAAKVLRGER